MMLIKNVHVVDPQIELDEVCDIRFDTDVAQGKIVELGKNLDEKNGEEVLDATGKYLVPGLVDMHVHFRDPGFEYKETIETGARAAIKGGFTDVATMPNTDPVCDTGTAIRYQIDRAHMAGFARVHPIGALTKGEKGEALAEIGDMTLEGACAFSDDGHGVQSAGMMRTCMEYVSQFDRCVISHCEDESLAGSGVINEGRASTRLGMFGIPALAEELQVERDINLCRLTGCPLHIAHISTKRSLALVRQAKEEGLPITCEVTPHHLFLTEENITDSYNTNLKVNPPLRTQADAQALREGVCDGTIDCIATDHAPHAAHEKDCEFEIAYFGSIGLETCLPLMLTHLVGKDKMDMVRLVELMAIKPRELLRLPKLSIQADMPADFTLIDPNKKVKIDTDYFESKSKNSAFLGQTFTGCATDVFIGGKHLLKDGSIQDN